MISQKIPAAVAAAVKEVYGLELTPEVSAADPQFGDYSTNVAFELAGRIGDVTPRDVAARLKPLVAQRLKAVAAAVESTDSGYLNITLSTKTLWQMTHRSIPTPYQGQTVVVEYSDANPFKILHAGHVYTTVVGDAVANLLETAGAKVHRVNFGGDVGLHVGKTVWAIVQKLGGEHPDRLAAISASERPAWMSARYVEGNAAYEDNEPAKAEIMAYNKQIYQIQAQPDHDSALAQIYWTCRQWSYEAFDVFYTRFGTKLEKYYPESAVAELGLQVVRQHLGSVFEESDGAVVFRGEPYGLHTRVFISSQGLPTYEAKDVGLILQKFRDYHFDRSIVLTANEQQDYMAVVLKAIEQFEPDLVRASTYIPHGTLKLLGGIKMSSRMGNIVPAHAVLDITAAANHQAHGKDDERVVVGAVKYAFLKQRIGGDIIYDPDASVSILGNSGPYLQYAHARARSILAKAGAGAEEQDELELDERSLLRQLSLYPEVVERSITELRPHHICTYLYELAQVFNHFYEHHRVVGDDRATLRLALVERYAKTLHNGLELLGIDAPDTV